MIKVLIADDHPILRQGLQKIIDESSDIRVVAEANNGFDAIERMKAHEIDVAILDISMPELSGIEVIKRLIDEGNTIPVLVLSVHSMKQYAVRVLRLGALGYLTKETAEEELLAAIRTIAAGNKYISPSLAVELAEFVEHESWESPISKLSDREYEVLKSIVSGRSMKEIAFDLHITIQTASTYRARILKKLDLTTNAELIKFALENGLE